MGGGLFKGLLEYCMIPGIHDCGGGLGNQKRRGDRGSANRQARLEENRLHADPQGATAKFLVGVGAAQVVPGRRCKAVRAEWSFSLLIASTEANRQPTGFECLKERCHNVVIRGID